MKRKVKRIRLRKEVKFVLKVLAFILLLVAVVMLMKAANNKYVSMFEACDNAKGYTCSYYEARQYAIRGE